MTMYATPTMMSDVSETSVTFRRGSPRSKIASARRLMMVKASRMFSQRWNAPQRRALPRTWITAEATAPSRYAPKTMTTRRMRLRFWGANRLMR